MRRVVALFLALGLAAAASAQPTHLLSIDYEETQGDLRAATLALAPSSGDAAPLRPETFAQIGVLSARGQWIIIEKLLSSGHQTGIQARAKLPAPDAILMVLVKPTRGPWRGWRVADERYANLEVSYFDQRGRRVESGPCEPRACFANVVDRFNQAETLASSFQVEIDGVSSGR